MCVDENGCDTDEYIVFSEWSFVLGTKMQRKDFRFDRLLAGEYDPKRGSRKRENNIGSANREHKQLNLIDIEEQEEPKEEGELLTCYIADYRRIQYDG